MGCVETADKKNRWLLGMADLENSSRLLLTLEKEYSNWGNKWTIEVDPCGRSISPAVLDIRQLVLIAATREKIGFWGLGGCSYVLLLSGALVLTAWMVYAVCSRSKRGNFEPKTRRSTVPGR